MKVIFVHGRAQEHKIAADLLKVWNNAMNGALKAGGFLAFADADVVLPYYGDLLFKLTEDAGKESFQTLVDRGADAAAPSAEEQRFTQEIILEMAAAQNLTDAQIAAEAQLDVVDRGVQNWRIVLAALRLLDKIKGVGQNSIEMFTRDVWYYLTRKGLRLQINAIVDEVIPKDEKCIVVSHSLGTVVGYNVVMNRPLRQNIKGFITIGSPLGINAIYSRLPSDTPPRKSPGGIPVWFNARDAKDIVALYEIPSERYQGLPVVSNYSGVNNTSENHHGIVEYLSDSTVAKTIYEAATAP